MKSNFTCIKKMPVYLLSASFCLGMFSCQDDVRTDGYSTMDVPELHALSAEQKEVIDYTPKNIVIAHRGTEFWAPEESEAAMRWARNIGADYIECDLQKTKDGVILALHDESLLRTTDVEVIYPSRQNDYVSAFTYDELLKLDIGSWFNEANPEQARSSFVGLDILTLDDVLMIAEGYRIKRDANGKRIVNRDEKGNYVSTQYELDPYDSGNRPGIYIEFKESWAQPSDMEARVYQELDKWGWNIITKPADGQPFYKSGKVNVGNTNGKVILQTFSFDAANRTYSVYKGRIPMCYLLWTGTPAYATDIAYDTPTGLADFIKYMQDHGCHIIGPAISGAPNNYPEMNNPWQAYMVRRAGMINHPYSFDSQAQLTKHMGYWNYGYETPFDEMKVTVPKTSVSTFPGDSQTWPIYMDGCFTNHTEMNLQYMLDNGMRGNANLPNPFHAGQKFDNSQAPLTVPDANELLNKLGY